MKKYFFVAALISGCCLQAYSQNSEALRRDSLSLDSAKSIVHFLMDTAKVEMLNQIALRTGYITSHERRIAISFQYATEALKEATQIGYKQGIAMALLILSGSSRDSTLNMPGDVALKQNYFLKAFHVAQEINNYELLGWCYYYMSGMPTYTMNSNESVIDFYTKSINYFLKAGDTLLAAEVTNWLSEDYKDLGDYEDAFDYGKKSYYLSKTASGANFSISWQQFLVQYSLSNMYDLYTSACDYDQAMNYLREMDQYGKDHQGAEWDIIQFTADLFCKMGKYDSALIYINRWINNGAAINSGKGHQAVGWGILAKIYLDSTKEYDKALELFSNWCDTLKKYHPAGIYATTDFLISIGHAHDGKKNYNTALQYAKQGLSLAQEKNNRPIMMHGYQVLSTVYHHLGKNDSAYEYLLKYNAIKDSIQNKQFLLRIYNSKKDAEDEKKEAQLLLLDKDNKIKTGQLKHESQQKNFLFILLSVLVLAGIFVYRAIYLKRKNERLRLENALRVQRLESEKKQAELKRQASDLQMQALRAQMNPHFIFNSLSSINWFILENDKDTASDYLTRFSRLMRMILNSQKPMILLEDELKMLQLYLDLERLRFEYAFDYSITFTNTVDAGSVSIPPMLLQPFCENAIWHGFRNKEGQGNININIRTEDRLLECMITDNGIGRQQAAAFKTKSTKKEKSLGLEITRERLALFSAENNAVADFEMEDLADENGSSTGTRVILKITYKELIEEAA